jgi:hypothetical protein
MSDLSQGGRHTDEYITGSRRELAMRAMWPVVGPETYRDRCCVRRLGFGAPATRRPALNGVYPLSLSRRRRSPSSEERAALTTSASIVSCGQPSLTPCHRSRELRLAGQGDADGARRLRRDAGLIARARSATGASTTAAMTAKAATAIVNTATASTAMSPSALPVRR